MPTTHSAANATGTVATHRATLHDLDRLAPLFDAYRSFYGKASDPDLARRFLHDRFERNESVVFIAVDGDITLGFTQLYPLFSSVRAARTWLLNDLFVAANARQRGVARALLATAADFARNDGAARMTLSTALDNTAARRLYESSGWTLDTGFCEYAITP